MVLLLMCIMTIWESLSALDTPKGGDKAHPWNDGRVDSFWNLAELFFTLFFVVEACLKILVYGWSDYWREHMNRYAPPDSLLPGSLSLTTSTCFDCADTWASGKALGCAWSCLVVFAHASFCVGLLSPSRYLALRECASVC